MKRFRKMDNKIKKKQDQYRTQFTLPGPYWFLIWPSIVFFAAIFALIKYKASFSTILSVIMVFALFIIFILLLRKFKKSL